MFIESSSTGAKRSGEVASQLVGSPEGEAKLVRSLGWVLEERLIGVSDGSGSPSGGATSCSATSPERFAPVEEFLRVLGQKSGG